MESNNFKLALAQYILPLIPDNCTLGIGTGKTVNELINLLSSIKAKLNHLVASSEATRQLLIKNNLPVADINSVEEIDVYIDSADECTPEKFLTKGGGGALTREKILATMAKQFWCLVENHKMSPKLGEFPIPVEVIPMARRLVVNKILQMHGTPVLRENFITDNGNIIIDIKGLDIPQPLVLEQQLKSKTGIVDRGIFAKRIPNKLVVARADGIVVL